jgi:alpha-mannosidase
LRARLSVGGSSLTLTAWLGRSSKRLDFVADVDWRENRRMLRVSFPTTIHAPEASFEIQYGYVKRPSHTNTSWDAARFEVVGHRFADLSEPDYGVALLNDCKYGYKVRDHVLDLNLLRAPMDPDPIADRGQHSIRWALLPHAGDLAHSDVFAEAAMLNQGLVVLPSIDAAGATLPVRLEGEGIELSVLKKAEEQDCLVVRVVERCGTRTRGRLVARDAKARFVPTDLVEWRDDDQAASHGSVTLDLAPFEIRTYKLEGTG